IVADRAEIDQLRDLRQKYFSGAAPAINADLPGMGDAMKDSDLERLDDLKQGLFDSEFVRQMIANRGGAALMAQDAIARSANDSGNAGLNDSMRQMAQSIVDSQNAEIKELKDLESEDKK
ncbi:MAG: DUF305 domain-containing protein, partial [Pyrinomonadaceae bacterium]